MILHFFTCFFITINLVFTSDTPNFKRNELDSSISDIMWCGNNREVIFALTELSSVYKSEDKGFSWRKLNDIFHSKATLELEPNENEIGKVSRLIQSPVDKTLMIFLGTHGINWIIYDCGRKGIKALNHGRKIQEFTFHPTERDWGLASAFTLCEDFKNEPCRYFKELFVTKDLGETWELIAGYVIQFSWGILNEEHIKNGIPKERILITHEPYNKGNQRNIGWNYKIDFVFSDDFFKTTKIGAHKGNKFLLTKEYLYLAQVLDQDTQEVMLLTANSNHKIYDFKHVELNNNKFSEHSYTFLDTSENSVFLHVTHHGEKSNYGTIYTSDETGVKFSQSINYNIRSKEGECEFSKVFGLDGIFIGNVIDPEIIEIKKQEINLENNEDLQSMTDQTHEKVSNPHLDYKEYTKTQITFNKGGKWHDLITEKEDSSNKPYDCGEFCSLHLHGLSSEFPPFYSVQSAVGLILANGNVGKYLSINPEEVATFISRDGGLMWKEIRKGSHIYEIGDHGGIIILAEDSHPTNSIHYTLNEGLTFNSIEISSEKMMIKNIIIEPTATSQHFLIYGESQTKKGEKLGVVIGIDFSSKNLPICKNSNIPIDINSDYEIWSPNDGRHGNKECMMGQKTIYVRRKREAECFNGENFERSKIIEYCQCTEEDFECDVGYFRNNPIDPCTPEVEIPDVEKNKPPSDCIGFYTISKGYRKIPTNKCTGGVTFEPIIVPCPHSGFFGKIGFILFIVLIVILIVLVFMVFNKNFLDNVKNFVKDSLEKKSSKDKEKKNYINIGRDEEDPDSDNILFDDKEIGENDDGKIHSNH